MIECVRLLCSERTGEIETVQRHPDWRCWFRYSIWPEKLFQLRNTDEIAWQKHGSRNSEIHPPKTQIYTLFW